MTLDELRAQVEQQIEQARQSHPQYTQIRAVQAACLAGGGRQPTSAESERVRAAVELIDADPHVSRLRTQLRAVESEAQRDEVDAARAAVTTPTAAVSAYTTTTYSVGDDRSSVGGGASQQRAGFSRNAGDGVIGYEQRTYNPDNANNSLDREGPRSWLKDLYRMNVHNDEGARIRLQRHAREVEVNNEQTSRALSTGSFAGNVPPQYLLDLVAPVVRAGRPFANTVTNLPLPETGMTFNIPKGTTGASVAIQSTQNTSVSSTDEVWGDLVLPVATAAGQQDVSRQSLERGAAGNDALVFMDLAGAYAVNLDQQLLSGSGSSGQVLGVLNTSGVLQATAYTAAATVQTFYSKVNGAVSAITSSRFLAPTHMALAPRRSSWLSNQFDNNGRPLVVPSSQAPQNAVGVDKELLNLHQVVDPSMPVAVGSGPEDLVIVYRAADLILFEDGDGMPRELRFEQTLGNQLTVKLVSYGYFGFTAARYPNAVQIIGGNSAAGFGQVAPTF
ncbi:MAG: hypothetical protein QOE23_2227 [Pseudonocardiales bacterium]|jgi:HK97 family phage major capsid protein|nr:hypothetical protein [Pseudonocardiales bacterium]